jgi:hypothetical protein
MLTGALAKIYVVPAPAGAAQGAFTRTALAARSGLLTLPALMTVHAREDETDPIVRGKFVRERLLCEHLPPPPPNVNAVFPPPDPRLTMRERLAQHVKDPTCSSCHSLMDPIGLGLEHYDGIGRHRSTEAGKPIDAAGEIVGHGLRFGNALELGAGLAALPAARACFAGQLFGYAVGDDEAGLDECRLGDLAGRLDRAGGNIRELLVAILAGEDFYARASN